MNVFNIKNPSHKQILREELLRAKLILTEGFQYSTDEIWDAMSDDDKNTVLYSAKVENPEELINSDWDSIPADVQDTLDLSTYELAKYDIGGRTNLRAIAMWLKKMPNLRQLIAKFLDKNNRNDVKQLTVKQSTDLLLAMHKFKSVMEPSQQPASDDAAKQQWIDAERGSGRTSGLD
jgi:hypothetical protein